MMNSSSWNVYSLLKWLHLSPSRYIYHFNAERCRRFGVWNLRNSNTNGSGQPIGPNDFLITIRYRTTFSFSRMAPFLLWNDDGSSWLKAFSISRKNCRENKFARHRTVPIMYGIVAHGLTDPQRSTYIFYWWGILPRGERSWWTSFLARILLGLWAFFL